MADKVPREGQFSQLLGWCGEAIQEGESFLRSQSGYAKVDETIDMIMGEGADAPKPSVLSDITCNQLGKISLDLVASLTDIKPSWEYHTFNKKYEQQAEMLDKLSSSWFTGRNIDMKFSEVIIYALAAGTGFAHLTYNPDTQDLDMLSEDPRDVLPIRPSSLFSIQESMGVLLRRERTINAARAKYPRPLYGEIKIDREGSLKQTIRQSRIERLLTSMGLRSGFMENLYSSLGGRPQAASLNVPAVDIFTLYVTDNSLNESGREQQMGDPDTNWSYVVKPGEPLYPRKRLIIFTRSALLYDGPSIYWHGLFPTPKLTLDPFPWSWLGKAPLRDLLSLQKELTKLLRIVADHNAKVGRPDLKADKNSMSQRALERIDTRRSGLKIRYNPVAGRGVEYEYPDLLDPSVEKSIEFIIAQMKELSGVTDLTQLANLNQIPATETVEKMLESMSPIVRRRSRVMEAFLREVAMIVASNFFQFYTLSQRLAVLGPTGMTFEDFDFDPGNLIPAFIDENDFDEYGHPTQEALRRGPLPRHQRAQAFLRNFTYHVAPGSLLSAAGITKKLMYLQLGRMGYVDIITMLEQLEVPNVGAPEEAGQTIMDRLKWQQMQGIGMQVGPAGATQGRKASGQAMPRMTIKES